MPHVVVGTEHDTPVELYYEDHGTGRPVVLLQGFPLDGAAWEPQTLLLLEAGYRVITLDRRGFGRSSRPMGGYDYDTFADDLDALLGHLALTDVSLVGFSMGTADIERYIGRHGSSRVRSAVLLAPFGPGIRATEDDPIGFPEEVFAALAAAIRADRFQYLQNYFLQHYCADQNLGSRVSEPTLRAHFQSAASASGWAMLHCVEAWKEDFRADLARIDVPLLVMQGTEDRNIPIDFGARRVKEFVPRATVIEVPGGPHGIAVTHPEVVHPALLDFLAR